MFGWVTDTINKCRVDEHRRGLLAAIEKYGWTANYVMAENNPELDFAYTIGFSDLGAPELLVFSLDPRWVNHVFWEAFDRVKSGAGLPHGYRYVYPEPDGGGFECKFLTATHPDAWSKYAFDAIAYSRFKGRGDRPEVMQVVCPSVDDNLYPWQKGCPQAIVDAQPRLYSWTE